MIRVKPPKQPAPKVTGHKGYPYEPPTFDTRMARVRDMMKMMERSVALGFPVDRLREAIEYELKHMGVV